MDKPITGVHIQTLSNPKNYSEYQLDRVCTIARSLDRGTFVLCEPPRDEPA